MPGNSTEPRAAPRLRGAASFCTARAGAGGAADPSAAVHMKGQTFLKGALIVSLGGIVAKIMGAFYRIPLANLLGGRGLGIYQMTYPLYCLLLTVSATGIPSGLARAVSRAEASGDRVRSDGYLRSSLLLFAGIGLLGSAAMFLLAPLMSAAQGEPAAAAAYRALAPGVLLVSLVSCFRGWFQGKSNFLPTAMSEIIEQAFKVGLGLLFARMFAGEGANSARRSTVTVPPCRPPPPFCA